MRPLALKAVLALGLISPGSGPLHFLLTAAPQLSKKSYIVSWLLQLKKQCGAALCVLLCGG
jgi:hypothetical protein